MNDKDRAYLHSTRYRVLNVVIWALLGASYFLPQYRVQLLLAGVAVSTVALLPLMPSAWKMRHRKLNMQNKRDRAYVLSIVLFVGLLVLSTFLFALYRH
jgi:hypothetical protein